MPGVVFEEVTKACLVLRVQDRGLCVNVLLIGSERVLFLSWYSSSPQDLHFLAGIPRCGVLYLASSVNWPLHPLLHKQRELLPCKPEFLAILDSTDRISLTFLHILHYILHNQIHPNRSICILWVNLALSPLPSPPPPPPGTQPA